MADLSHGAGATATMIGTNRPHIAPGGWTIRTAPRPQTRER